MTDKRSIMQSIDTHKRELKRLEDELAKIPEGQMSKLRKYLRNRIMPHSSWGFNWELIDSFQNETIGVRFQPYYSLGELGIRTPRIEWLIENIFNDGVYTIKSAYATKEGLVLEVHRNI